MRTQQQIEAAMEARARRAARRVGLIAKKSRRWVGSVFNHGGFMLVDGYYGHLVMGEWFDLTPEDVISYCED
jgi:hypothetical protein